MALWRLRHADEDKSLITKDSHRRVRDNDTVGWWHNPWHYGG
jgi:hypothetical protein